MYAKTLAEIIDSLPEPLQSPTPTLLYPLPFIANYLLCLFNCKQDSSFDLDDFALHRLVKDEQYLDLEWSLLKRLLGKEECKIYSTRRPDGIHMLAISKELFDGLLNDMLDSLAAISSSMFVINIPFTKYVSSNTTWIAPKKYDKLKGQLKRDRDHNLFILEGTVIATSFIKHLSVTLPTSLVCLDIEAFEFNHRQLLEIGIVTLSIQKDSTNGSIIVLSQPIAQHYLIQEHASLFNGRNVANRKHHFAFGTSIETSTLEVSLKLHSLLSLPHTILIGHNILSDIEFLKGAGHPIPSHLQTQIFDTQLMFAQAKRQPNERSSLEKCMSSLGIIGNHHTSHLHNAGNDAWYTMVVFLLLIDCKPDWQSWYHSTLNGKYSLGTKNDIPIHATRVPSKQEHNYKSKRRYV